MLQFTRSVPEARRWAYRAKVKLVAHWLGDAWTFGMESRDEFIPIPQCPVHSAMVNNALAVLANALPPPDVFPLRYFVQSGALITLVLKTKKLPAADWLTREVIEALSQTGICGLHLNLHPAAGRILFSKSWHSLWGETRVQDALGLWHGPAAFAQLIPELYAESLDLAESFLAPAANDAVIDLCSGIGVSLQRWAARGARCIGVECDGDAIACAALNAPRAEMLRGLCSQRLPQLREWTQQRVGLLLAYVNPPRLGLEPEVLAWLCNEAQPERIAYLSCSAGTLRRDLSALTKAGWQVMNLQPFDFFPQTHHVETLALLTRSPAA